MLYVIGIEIGKGEAVVVRNIMNAGAVISVLHVLKKSGNKAFIAFDVPPQVIHKAVVVAQDPVRIKSHQFFVGLCHKKNAV